MNRQVAIAAISAALAFWLLVQVAIYPKATRTTLYLVMIPVIVSVAIMAGFLPWHR